jgi:hypothetical protein
LNPQPADYKSAALPIELHQHNFTNRARNDLKINGEKAGLRGIFPLLFGLSAPLFSVDLNIKRYFRFFQV